MKKIKLAAMFAAVVAMLGFSSCLGGDTNNIATGMEYVKYTGMPGYSSFENSAGLRLEPSNQKQWAETSVTTPYVIIQYQYSPDSIKQNSKRLPITLQGMAEVKDAQYSMEDTEWANAPIYLAGLAAFPYYDKNNLFLGVQYYVKSGSDGKVDASDSQTGAHQFSLYCAKTEKESISGSNLVLYVHHKVNDLSTNKDRKSTNGFEYVRFSLSDALNWYKGVKEGALPDNLIIKWKVPGSLSGDDMLDYDKAKDVSTSLSIPYAKYFKESK